MITIIPPIRGRDRHGSGHYGASRDKGTRKHKGVDPACYPGSQILAWDDLFVMRRGRVYRYEVENKRHLQLVELEDDAGSLIRVMYIEPHVKKGDQLRHGDLIGISQKYPARGITQHVHIDVKAFKPGKKRRAFVNPEKYFQGIIE